MWEPVIDIKLVIIMFYYNINNMENNFLHCSHQKTIIKS